MFYNMQTCYYLRSLNKFGRKFSSSLSAAEPHAKEEIHLSGNSYKKDDYTNITSKIVSYMGRNLHTSQHHPLSLVRQKIVNYFYKAFTNSRGNPSFAVFDNISPVVSTEQNFSSLLTPADHPSRSKSDCYYINRNYLLRGHTTAHQSELIKSGLNNFLVVGDVYRRDEIDQTHYPVFHQLDAVRLKTRDELFSYNQSRQIFGENDHNGSSAQKCHTLEAVELMESELKKTLVALSQELFGKNIEYRWVDTFFPFTNPSWELEIYHDNKWMELLGCGIMQQEILNKSGAQDKIGWAFGIGLERVSMLLYKIPDIRLFWSTDSGFLNQFKTNEKNVVYKPISRFPQCINDISFWLPANSEYNSNDFYDLVRTVGGDVVEQVKLVDEFKHPKNGNISHCYRITYRHMEKTFTQAEVNVIHKNIGLIATNQLGICLR